MEIKKYILKKFDYDVDISNKKFYTLNETIKQKLGIGVRFLEDKKNIDLTFKIDMIDRIIKNYGTSKELWKNFQNKYDLKMKELKENPMIFNFERENEISSDIANNILNNTSERLVIA